MKISIVLIVLTMVLHALHATSQEIKDKALIETTCKNTPHYQLCITVLSSDPQSATADVRGLSLVMVAAVKAKTKAALSIINNLTQRADPKLAPALEKCTNVYNAVKKADVKMAVDALTKGNFKFAENGMADAVVEADICEGSFQRLGVKSPLTEVNTAVHDLAEVARAVIRNLL